MGDALPTDLRVVDTQFLIVGAGPAGASLACFLAFQGEYNSQSLTIISFHIHGYVYMFFFLLLIVGYDEI